MARRDEIDNQSRSRDVRNFAVVVQMPTPVDGQTIRIEPDSDYPFEVLDIRALIVVGTAEITPMIDGQVIDTSGSDSSGVILVKEPAMTTWVPDGSIFEVGAGEALTFDVDNVTSDGATLVVRFALRRTDENVVVT